MNNHYRTLGVDPAAEDLVIRGAYVALMRRYHPDRSGDAQDADRAREITAAYDILRDPVRRAAYDAQRAAVVASGPITAAISPARVRGGSTGRNGFLAIVLATTGLAYWGWSRSAPPAGSEHSVEQGARQTLAPAEPAVRPPADEATQEPPLDVLTPVEADIDPPQPQDLAVSVVSATLPEKPRLSGRDANSLPSAEQARPTAEDRPAVRPAPPRQPRAPAPAATTNFASLEQHLQRLTDQSMRVGTAAERALLFTTSSRFVARLDGCADDLCRRDAYLARNQEIARIMRD